jgi:hypothetical protein
MREFDMAYRVVERGDWAALTKGLSQTLEGERVEIEIAALGVGDQRETEWVPLLGLAYDRKDDIFEVDVEGLDHLIQHPDSLVVQQEGARVRSLVVGTTTGERHVLRFREPISLPPPGA